ncbi:glycosyltransferase [Paenibacillus sacheonensis]|uniref:Glycosyltransferase n=1 Tax=Paenibacillus sacheonensis TaxID=742054 RepID=A0A7X5C0H0_9BACL|nr:glycosyltransferase [Paenibacillus sacheonensis]MBM7569273.1 glycosyltransferase involved in cell wall biosynthesis [Paenibacillus sacheonensis]NBC71717.1 glycosyltransferase [Paenibacillus sacheonensis]
MGVQPSKPLVTIVIPFYNDPYVAEAVESALSQTYGNIEIIVVDDGSTVHQEPLERYAGRIHYIGKANGGTASALNTGFRLAGGKYVAWLSSDDRFYPDKIKRQVEAMERTGAQISHTGFDIINGRGMMTDFNIIPPSTATGDFYRAFQNSNPVNGCTVVMTKELYRIIGSFNETMRYTHDLDYWFRVLLSGTPFQLLPEPLCAYRKHEQMGTVKHAEVIAREVKSTFAKYEARWLLYLIQLGLVPRGGSPSPSRKAGLSGKPRGLPRSH